MVERFLTIMKLTENMRYPDNIASHGSQGFHVLVESTPSSATHKNLRNSLLQHASQFKKHIFEDIAISKAAARTRTILQESPSCTISQSSREPASGSIAIINAHNIPKVQSTHDQVPQETRWDDVFSEFKHNIETINARKSFYGDMAQKNIESKLRIIENEIALLRKTCTCFNISEIENVVNTFQTTSNHLKLRNALALPSNHIFYLYVCLRILTLSALRLDRPIIVITDGQYTSDIVNHLTSYSFNHLCLINRKSKRKEICPLTPGDLDNLTLPLIYFEELSKKSEKVLVVT